MWECLATDPNVQELIRGWKSEEARALLYKVLAVRSFPVTSDVHDRINGEPDLARLEAWLIGAVTAGTIGDVFRDDCIVQSDIQFLQRVSLAGAGRRRLQRDIVRAEYEIHLEGVHARDLPLVLLRDLADLVVEGSMRAARLAAEGRSTSRTMAPAWVAEAGGMRLVGFLGGSLVLDVRARPLAEIAPGVFSTGAGETALDLLMIAINDGLQGRCDSDRLDLGMLQTFARTRSLFSCGARGLRITRIGGSSIELAEPAVEQFQRLATETPAPKVERLVGQIDSLAMSTRTCLLKLADGTSLKGIVATTVDLDQMKSLLGVEVVVEGTLAFRPSGRPQGIEIEHVAVAQEPLVTSGEEIDPLFGQWPGEEDDEHL